MKYIIVVLAALSLSACSAVMAGSKDTKPLNQEEIKKELSEKNFEDHISDNIIKEIKINNTSYYKIYELEYDKHAKGRMYSHLFWGVITLGIKEIVNTPGEALVKGTPYYVKIKYTNGLIISVEILESISIS